MTNLEIIKNFILGETKGKCNHLRIDNNKLINYDTIIAYRLKENEIILNKTRYSRTTSKIQNLIRKNSHIVAEYQEKEFYEFV